MGAAVLGIFGNSKEEAIYPAYYVEADGRKTDGTNRYILRFAKDQLPRCEVDPVSWHPNVGIFGVHDGKEAPTLCGGVPPADD
jgi:hypothetical protein